MRCIVCERTPVDPAHVVPRKRGGCDDAACVIPLCRTHHRLYDHGELALSPYIGDDLVLELEHALTHVGALELDSALRGAGWTAA